jgi:hypothetical protein
MHLLPTVMRNWPPLFERDQKGMFDCGSPTTTKRLQKQCLKHADADALDLFAAIGQAKKTL